ncbi:MAG TPA: hypothetical protein DCW90_05540 [Lachnospiraceae bacterium]|nr:hypothetical protein [uncultured Lachnoclostridium sp.]HAU84968.1 hypothetical protein [Lachnospiraceae bacterium]
MKAFFNQEIIVCLVGILVGTIPSVIISYITHRHNLEALKLQIKNQREERVIEDKKKAYFNFILLQQKLVAQNSQCIYNGHSEPELNNEILRLNAIVKVDMELLYPQKIRELAIEICSMANPQSEKEVKEFNLRREKDMKEIRKLMLIDLGIH